MIGRFKSITKNVVKIDQNSLQPRSIKSYRCDFGADIPNFKGNIIQKYKSLIFKLLIFCFASTLCWTRWQRKSEIIFYWTHVFMVNCCILIFYPFSYFSFGSRFAWVSRRRLHVKIKTKKGTNCQLIDKSTTTTTTTIVYLCSFSFWGAIVDVYVLHLDISSTIRTHSANWIARRSPH